MRVNLILCIGFLLISYKAHALLCLGTQITSIQSSIDLTNAHQILSIEVSNNAIHIGACPFILTFSYGSGGQAAPGRAMSLGSSRWLYDLSKDSAGLQILRSSSDATAASVISGSIPGNTNSVTVTYYIHRDETNPWQRFGNYTDNFTVSLFESLLYLISLPMDSKNVTVNYSAPRKADLSLVDSGGAFNISDVTQTLDFGTLIPGAAQGFDLILKFNAGARLLASSQNSGSLKHSSAASTVPYTFGFNGVSVNLAGSATTPVSLMNTTGASPPSGTVLPIQITVGNTSGALSGTYNDKVTFTIESTE